MSLHGDLLEQARHLAKKEPKRPKQASLRRAISAAHCAVFHRLTDAGARFVVRGNDRTELRLAVARGFEHAEMKKAATSFTGGTLPLVLQPAVPTPPGVPAALKQLAQTFIDLQQARHDADYDLSRAFTRQGTVDLVSQAEQAFKDWKSVDGTGSGRCVPRGAPPPGEDRSKVGNE